jgi:nucleoside-diphosphate-sugar epimerase
MRTLFTGGAGSIGSNLVEELLKAGEDILVLDNMHTVSPSNHLGILFTSPMYKKNSYLVGEAFGFKKERRGSF